jgi:hypothetical protein
MTDLSAIAGSAKASFSKTQMALPGHSRIVADILKSIDAFEVTLDIGGNIEQPDVQARSDLDRKISAALGKSMQKEVERYQKELKTMMDEQLKGELNSLGKEAGTIPDISGAARQERGKLGGMDTGGLLKQGGGLKNLLPF